ncbi:hypothetical protein BH10PLA1_BH10PLA1_11820 [soil metagenome]
MKYRNLFLSVILLAAPLASAQNLSALMSEALDKQVKLDLAGPLPKAMDKIGDDTGVRIQADPAVWDLLPWGEQTNLTAHIENQTLRQALAGITQKLGLTFDVKDQYVELKPTPPLRRLGRRATVGELHALDLLAATPITFSSDRPTVKQLVAAVDAKLQEIDPKGLAVEYRTGDTVLADQPVFVSRNATVSDALEALVTSTRATWYPWGKSIVIVPKEDQIRNQLAKTVTVRYNGVDISQVLTELAQAAGVEFTIQPGAVQKIPADFRKVNLLLDNATVKQALENISGFTGLGYVVNEKGVYIWNQSAETPAVGGRDPIIGSIPLDGMQLFIQTSAVPPDVREYLNYKKQVEIEKVRQKMKDEGFKPATQPAPTTQPAGTL